MKQVHMENFLYCYCTQMCEVAHPPNKQFGFEVEGTNLVKLMKKNARSRFQGDETYWIHRRYFNLCPPPW